MTLYRPLSRALPVLLVCAGAALAQPGQLLGPAAQSRTLQDSNLKPALPGALQGVGIDQRLDQQIPLNLMFKDEAGRSVPLSSFFETGKPVILALVYYRCPMLCTQILNGLAGSLKAITLNPGKDFEIVAISFDPKDTRNRSQQERSVHERYGRLAEHGERLASVDRRCQREHQGADRQEGHAISNDAATDQFAHASGIMVAIEGRLSRYFYGVEYAPGGRASGSVEASKTRSAPWSIRFSCSVITMRRRENTARP